VPEPATHHVSRVILRDLLVLQGVTAAGGAKLTNPNEQQALMLALTDSQAQKLLWIQQNGEWSLELRPPTNAADSPESAETAETLLRDGLPASQYARLAGKGLR
jgi:Flp pilus assembly protein CpaB